VILRKIATWIVLLFATACLAVAVVMHVSYVFGHVLGGKALFDAMLYCLFVNAFAWILLLYAYGGATFARSYREALTPPASVQERYYAAFYRLPSAFKWTYTAIGVYAAGSFVIRMFVDHDVSVVDGWTVTWIDRSLSGIFIVFFSFLSATMLAWLKPEK
jgi:hypothetical protein